MQKTNLKHNEVRFKRANRLVLKHYWRETKRNWKFSFPGLVFPAIGTIFVAYIPPLLIERVVSRGTNHPGSQFSDFVPYVFLFAFSWLFGEALWRLGVYFMIRAEVRSVKTLYENGLSNLLKQDISFFQDNFAGSLTKKTLGYATRYVDVADTMMFNVVSRLVPVIFASAVLATYSVWLVICLFAWIGLTAALVLPLIRKRRRLVTARETASNVVSGHIADVYGNIDAVRAHANEHGEEKRNRYFVNDLIKKMQLSWDYQNQKIDILISPLYVVTNASGLLLSLYLLQRGSIEATSIIVIFSYYFLVTNFMWEFNGIYRRLESAFSDAAQYTELLLTEPTILDPREPKQIPNPRGTITFKNVHFSYEENSKRLFTNFSLTIKAGEKIGLVGRSGGGKSSITKLLLRFSDIDEGTITIDEVDIRNIKQDELRSLIAYVPQDPAMFHRSITENIAYGKPDADEADIINVSNNAHAHEFIKNLPLQYKTLVGERGVKLSGGQRQRVAIARAMLKNAPILLLDEATSALDSESEKLIQNALWKLMENKTAIVIAHRLSTIQKMDRIIVLNEGKIIEDGSHQELIKHGGVYSELWNHQSGGFLED